MVSMGFYKKLWFSLQQGVFPEHISSIDNFYHSKDFAYNQTFWFSFSWRRPFLKPTSDLISEICKKVAAYWQKGL